MDWVVQQTAERSAAEYVPVEPFYSALPDQSMNAVQIAFGDLNSLQDRSLIRLAAGLGGIESFDVLVTAEGRAFVERLQAARANKPARRAVCCDAVVAWLYSCDAVRPPGLALERIRDDLARGYCFAEPFSDSDLDTASAWLHRQGLVDGAIVDQAEGPVIAYLTDAGAECAEDHEADTRAYFEQQRPPVPRRAVDTGARSEPLLAPDALQIPAQLAGDPAILGEVSGGLAEWAEAQMTEGQRQAKRRSWVDKYRPALDLAFSDFLTSAQWPERERFRRRLAQRGLSDISLDEMLREMPRSHWERNLVVPDQIVLSLQVLQEMSKAQDLMAACIAIVKRAYELYISETEEDPELRSDDPTLIGAAGYDPALLLRAREGAKPASTKPPGRRHVWYRHYRLDQAPERGSDAVLQRRRYSQRLPHRPRKHHHRRSPPLRPGISGANDSTFRHDGHQARVREPAGRSRASGRTLCGHAVRRNLV
jgi:hypothetical protein